MGMDINIAVFDGFEPLDVFGPFEVSSILMVPECGFSLLTGPV